MSPQLPDPQEECCHLKEYLEIYICAKFIIYYPTNQNLSTHSSNQDQWKTFDKIELIFNVFSKRKKSKLTNIISKYTWIWCIALKLCTKFCFYPTYTKSLADTSAEEKKKRKKTKWYVPHVMSQTSCATCLLTPVTCHLSPVTCYLTTTLCSFSCYESPGM